MFFLAWIWHHPFSLVRDQMEKAEEGWNLSHAFPSRINLRSGCKTGERGVWRWGEGGGKAGGAGMEGVGTRLHHSLTFLPATKVIPELWSRATTWNYLQRTSLAYILWQNLAKISLLLSVSPAVCKCLCCWLRTGQFSLSFAQSPPVFLEVLPVHCSSTGKKKRIFIEKQSFHQQSW